MKWFLSVALISSVFSAEVISANPARWADPSLPVGEGLELWLDASRENEAREAYYMNRLTEGQGMELWHDSSGNSRHLTQWSAAMRPAWRQGTVSFDGDDFLAALLTPGLESKTCTAFVVAAPEGSTGDFPALLSAARRGENDYTSGLTMDFGGPAAPAGKLDNLNVEGAGQTGARNLLDAAVPADRGYFFTVCSGEGHSSLRVDGKAGGGRDRSDVAFSMDRVAVGARFVSPEMRHFYKGRIAEVLFYNRSLTEFEISATEAWLAKKHAAFLLPPDPDATAESPLIPVRDAPPLQMLVPGFRVDELPVRLTNLNNIEYAPDGRLFAGGYDGRFHLLRDTDGDGLEDKVDTFSPAASDDYPLGLVVRDGMPHALLSDEIIRFRDTDGDGVPDRRETVAKGWDDPALRDNPGLMHRRVDSAMALAAGPDGSWYVTMGSANPGNGYWQKAEGDVWAPATLKTGQPQYSPDKRRGCLLRIAPDGKVTQLASGLRYIMSLQWDASGELFATDQEGATWLPNGNPFDELLHLQAGRHYGFPPSHPRLLPNVVDEPSVWNFSPQHESACGFRFNGPAPDRARFGPEFWAHDAFVTGESRGKLWRTSLARTAAGYVADTKLIACCGLLMVDCAMSPQGDLVICCHSGAPDWGSGPTGMGRLFKIRHTRPGAAQPVLAYARDATTTVIQFDRRLEAADWRDDPAKRVHIEAGKFVTAGERFEMIRPGYAVVRAQEGTPRYRLPVKGASLSLDGRSLILTTAARTSAVNYAVTLDLPRKQEGIRQVDAVDLAFGLDGLESHWQGSTGDGDDWRGWLPHPDLAAAKALTRGSAEHESVWQKIATPGRLTMRTRLDLAHLLQPAVQPGSKLDYTPEPEVVTITLKSDAALSAQAPGCEIKRTGENELSLTRSVNPAEWQDLILELATPATRLDVAFTTTRDAQPRPLGIQRFHLPFASPDTEVLRKTVIPEIVGGDPAKGRALFFGKATCFMCHQLQGEGHAVGPDLSNTAHRDYASVLRDITDPNATINPDAVAYVIEMKDGKTVVGPRVGENASEISLAAPGGVVTVLKKTDIKSSSALPVSLMPQGLTAALDGAELKDLMTFLLTEPAPPARRQ